MTVGQGQREILGLFTLADEDRAVFVDLRYPEALLQPTDGSDILKYRRQANARDGALRSRR
jgi:hypothetical protein